MACFYGSKCSLPRIHIIANRTATDHFKQPSYQNGACVFK